MKYSRLFVTSLMAMPSGGFLFSALVTSAGGRSGGGINPLSYPFSEYHGYVKAYDGDPVSGATVSVDDGQWTTTTNQNGFYCISTSSGNHDVEAKKVDYHNQTKEDVNTNGWTTRVDFKIVKDSDMDGFRDDYESRVDSDPDDDGEQPTADGFWFWNAPDGEKTLKDYMGQDGVIPLLEDLGYDGDIHEDYSDEEVEEYVRKNTGGRDSAVFVYVGEGSDTGNCLKCDKETTLCGSIRHITKSDAEDFDMDYLYFVFLGACRTHDSGTDYWEAWISNDNGGDRDGTGGAEAGIFYEDEVSSAMLDSFAWAFFTELCQNKGTVNEAFSAGLDEQSDGEDHHPRKEGDCSIRLKWKR